MNGLIIVGIVLIGIILAGGVVAGRIRRKVRSFSRQAFGTDSLAEGWRQQEEELASTPKSVSGMTRIYEPQIHRDFPEFNWLEFKNKAENMLRSAFLAIEEEDIKCLADASEELHKQVEIKIQQNQAEGVAEHYQNVIVHNTEITRYEKKQGKCIITLQSAVGHLHYKSKDGKVISGDDRLDKQTKYNIEILYIQNPELETADRALGMTCPHCGAPVTGVGQLKCDYCGSGITPINHQVWSLNKFYEVTYQNV